MSYVDHAAAESATDAESLPRVARAEVARLALAVRAARRELDLRELEAAEAHARAASAEAFLEESLARLVEDRRQACQRELADARIAAEHLRRATQPFHLRVVDGVEPEPRHEDAPIPNGTDADDTPDRPITRESSDEAPTIVQRVQASVDAVAHTSAHVSPDELREVVKAAVVAGLAEATERAVATMRLVPALATPAAYGHAAPQDATRRSTELVAEPPMWRRLAHLDVLLPLVAAIIVVLVFFAWVG